MDSLQDIGSLPVWRGDIAMNWREVPEYDFDVSRQIIEFENTSAQIVPIFGYKPHKFTFSVSSLEKSSEYALLQFFAECYGKTKKFWFPLPMAIFTMLQAVSSGSFEIAVAANDFEFYGYERLYILLTDGDLITRKIDSLGLSEDEITLTLHTALDRDIEVGDVEILSLLPLVRFENDTLDIEYINRDVSETKISLVELVQEYSEV